MKTGLDDFFADGHSVEDLLALATPELRKPPEESPEPGSGASLVLWDDEPQRITRPMTLLPSGIAVAAVPLPVGVPREDGSGVRSQDALFVVTGDGELLSQHEAEARGLQLEIADAAPVRWSRAGIKRFIEGHRPDGKELLHELTTTFSYYIAFETVPPLTEERMARLLALTALTSYFTAAFPAIFYLHFIGGKGSGKSKAQELHALLSFNGVWVIATTTTAAIRRVAASGGLIAIDDTENLNPKDDPERYSLQLSGYRSNATFQLVEDDGRGGKRVRSIPVYGMRTFSSIKEMDDTLRSRLIPIPLVRSVGRQANRAPGIGQMPCRPFATLCDDALAFALPRLHEAADLYSRLARSEVMSGRDFDVTGPLLTIAYMIGGLKLYHETLETLKVLLSLRDDQGDEPREVPVLRALLSLMSDATEPRETSPSTITGWIETNDPESAHYTDQNGNERSRYNARSVGWILTRLQVGQKRRAGKGVFVLIFPELLAKRVEAYGGRAKILREDPEEGTEKTTRTTQTTETTPGASVVCAENVVDVVFPEGTEPGARDTLRNGHKPECATVAARPSTIPAPAGDPGLIDRDSGAWEEF